jgi:hypothetical protein
MANGKIASQEEAQSMGRRTLSGWRLEAEGRRQRTEVRSRRLEVGGALCFRLEAKVRRQRADCGLRRGARRRAQGN